MHRVRSSQICSSREESSRDKGLAVAHVLKCMLTVNWNMFRMCKSIVDWNSSFSFLAPPLPTNKAGWTFTVDCSGIIINHHFIGTRPQNCEVFSEASFGGLGGRRSPKEKEKKKKRKKKE